MYYKNIKAALNALSLDTGFNPFVTGHIKGQATRAKLASLGYPVDPVLAAAEAVARQESDRIRIAEEEAEQKRRIAARARQAGEAADRVAISAAMGVACALHPGLRVSHCDIKMNAEMTVYHITPSNQALPIIIVEGGVARYADVRRNRTLGVLA